VWNFLLSYFSPPISAKIGAKYVRTSGILKYIVLYHNLFQGFVFFGTNFLAAAFVFCFVPEMAGLSLEEINGLFQAGIPAHRSFSYNREIRDKDRKNQEIIKAGGVARLGGQDSRDEKSDIG